MRPVRPGPLAALLTGIGLSTIAATGGLLASGMQDAGGQAQFTALSGPTISLPAAPEPRRAPVAKSERRSAPGTTTVAVTAQRRPAAGVRRSSRTATGVLLADRRSAGAPAGAPAAPVSAVGQEVTAPVATTASSRVSLRLDDFELEPATPGSKGRLRIRVSVAENAPEGDVPDAEALPSSFDVVVAVTEAPAGTSIRLAVELLRPDDAPADLRVQITYVQDSAEQATVADTAPATDVASNTLELRAPLDRPATTFTDREPAPDEPAPTAPATDVRVPVPAVEDEGGTSPVVEIPAEIPTETEPTAVAESG